MKALICPGGMPAHESGKDSSGQRTYKVLLDIAGLPQPNPISEVLDEEAERLRIIPQEVAHQAGYVALIVPRDDLEQVILSVDDAARSIGDPLELDVVPDPDRQMGIYGAVGGDGFLAEEQFIHRPTNL